MLPLLALYYMQLSHHVLWRDEFNVWGIACNSGSLTELMHRVSYEAHPALWYVICYAASRITHAVWILKLLQGAIGTAVYLVVAIATPFLWWEVLLVLGGFYISFHYTVLCRMYGLELLSALMYVRARVRRPDQPVRNALWLALLVNTEITGGILGCAFLLEMLLDRKAAEGNRAWRQVAAATGIFLAGAAISIWSLRPSPDIGWSSTGRPFSQIGSFEHFGLALGDWLGAAFVPTSVSVQTLWPELKPWPHALLLPLVVLLLVLTLRRNARLALLYGTVVIIGTLFAEIVNVSAVRHFGLEAIALLAVLWLMRAGGEKIPAAGYGLLLLLVIATVHNAVLQWGIPYADDDDAAHWISAQGLAGRPIMSWPDTSTIGVPERLGVPTYQLDCACWDRVMTFSRRRDATHDMKQIAPAVSKGLHTISGGRAVLLLAWPMSELDTNTLRAERIKATLLASFDRGYVQDEHFYIYDVEAAN